MVLNSGVESWIPALLVSTSNCSFSLAGEHTPHKTTTLSTRTIVKHNISTACPEPSHASNALLPKPYQGVGSAVRKATTSLSRQWSRAHRQEYADFSRLPRERDRNQDLFIRLMMIGYIAHRSGDTSHRGCRAEVAIGPC